MGGGRYHNNSRPICQVCGNIGHTAAYCYFGFNNNYMEPPPEPRKDNQSIAFIASPETLGDLAWYANSGASIHVTNNVGSLNQH